MGGQPQKRSMELWFSAFADSVAWCEQPRGNLHDSKSEWFISCKYWRGLKVIPINLHPRLPPWEGEKSLVCQVTSYNCTLPWLVSAWEHAPQEKNRKYVCMRTVAVTLQGDMHWGQWSLASASPASIPNLFTVIRDHHRTRDTSQKVTDLARKKLAKPLKEWKAL